jgi:hypothetical protein
VVLYEIQKPLTLDELNDAVKRGYLSVEYFNEQFQNAKDPNSKRFFKTLLDKAVASSRMKAAARLDALSALVTDRGFDALGRRLKQAADGVSMEVKHLLEKHEIPSIELLHEKSKSPDQFDLLVQKLSSSYENAAKLIKEFHQEYIEKIMNPLAKKELDSDKAAVDTLRLVRKTDSEIDSKLKEISRSI